jgi:hypothetical protein
MLQRLPEDGDATTVTNTARGSQKYGRHHRLFPEEGKGGGWSLALAQVTFGRGRLRCSAADMMNKTSQGGAPEEKKRDGREKEARGSLAAVNLAGGACRHRGVR